MIDIKKLIIGKERIGAINEINLPYLKEINKSDLVLVRCENKHIDEDLTHFKVFIYLRNESFPFIKNLVFRSRIYPLQFKRITDYLNHKIKNNEQNKKRNSY